MQFRPEQVFAIAFSILLITSPIASASAVGTDQRDGHSTNSVLSLISNTISDWITDVVRIGPKNKADGGNDEEKNKTDQPNRNKGKSKNGKKLNKSADSGSSNDEWKSGKQNDPGNGIGAPPHPNRDDEELRHNPQNKKANPGRERDDITRGPPEWSQGYAFFDGRNNHPLSFYSLFQNQSDREQQKVQEGLVVPNTTDDALTLRRLADAELADADFPKDQRKRFRYQLTDTEDFYIDGNRVTSVAVFRADKKVAAASHRVAPNATGYLIASDRALAAQAINDAHRTQDELDKRNVSYNSTAVTADLQEAEAAFDRGNRQIQKSRIPLGAMEQYRTAWVNAQRALDRMDEAVEPQVTIDDRSDMPHYETRTRTVNGTLFDVRPHELDAAVHVDGEEQPINVSANTVPATNTRFDTTVEVPPQLSNDTTVLSVNVSATDPGINYAERNSDTEDTLHGPQNNFNRLVLDGDGLPDEYEQTVTKTDPTDPISNSSRTEANESSNSVLDGAEDFDNDDVWTYEEYQLGLDSFDNDTDGDRLPDGFEVRYSFLDPLAQDSDGNGVPDGEEDFDDDSLGTAEEFDLGTDPFNDDSDGDRLSDGREQELGTDPLIQDTDEDGLTDYEEVELGTDPLNSDTDGDGTIDGEETYQSGTSDNETGVSLTVEANGLAETSIGITPRPNYHNDTSTSAGPTVYVTNRSTVESTTASIPIASYAEPNDDITIYHWDGTSEKPWTPVETTIDHENRTAVADVPASGFLTVLNRTEWRRATTLPEPEPVVISELPDGHCVGDCEVDGEKLVVGGSGSLSMNSRSDKQADSGILRLPTCEELDLPPDCRDDDDDPWIGDPDPGLDCSELRDDSVREQCEESNDDDDFNFDAREFTKSVPDGVEGDIVLRLVYRAEYDGSDSTVRVHVADGDGPTRTLTESNPGRVEIDVSSLEGRDVNVAVMTKNARAIVDSMVVFRDTDGDGLYDRHEERDWEYRYEERDWMWKLPYGEGQTISLDPNDPDTDGDGLSDSEEVTIEEVRFQDWPYLDGPAYRGKVTDATSNPAFANTDGAGLDDFDEVRKQGSNPWQEESLTVSAHLPTTFEVKDNEIVPVKKPYDTGVFDKRAWEIPLDGDEGRWRSTDSLGLSPKPDWLKGYETEEHIDYYLVEGFLYIGTNEYVEQNYDEYADDLPDSYNVELTDARVDIYGPDIENNGENLKPGSYKMKIIVKQKDTGNNGNVEFMLNHLGSLRVTANIGENSKFNHNGLISDQDNLKWSENKMVYITDNSYGVPFSPRSDYHERLGVGVDQLSTFTKVTMVGSAGMAGIGFFLASGSKRLAGIAFGVDLIAPKGPKIIKDAYTGSTTALFKESDVNNISDDSNGEIKFGSSGAHVIIRT